MSTAMRELLAVQRCSGWGKASMGEVEGAGGGLAEGDGQVALS